VTIGRTIAGRNGTVDDGTIGIREAEELSALLRHNDYRDKSFKQMMGEADAIHEVAKQKAKERQESGDPLSENFREGGKTNDEVADRISIGSGETYPCRRPMYQESGTKSLCAGVATSNRHTGHDLLGYGKDYVSEPEYLEARSRQNLAYSS
jgi:hypothetical protein